MLKSYSENFVTSYLFPARRNKNHQIHNRGRCMESTSTTERRRFLLPMMMCALTTSCLVVFCFQGLSHRSPRLVLSHNTRVSHVSRRKEEIYTEVTGTRYTNGGSCGGCTALHQLAIELKLLGQEVKTFSWKDMEASGWDCDVQNENTVVVFSEGLTQSCKILPRISVRWILAPLGSIYSHKVTEAWHEDDWVYNYGTYAPGAAMPVPDSNLLMVMRNPVEGDIFDLTTYGIQEQRKGTCFTFRKLDKFHSAEHVSQLHKPGDTPLDDAVEKAAEQLVTHEYFVSYDPYTYLSFAAAMLGCVPIVHPLGNMSKLEWIHSTAWGPYVRESNRTVLMDGVAYGNSTSEVNRARANLSLMRTELVRVKKWGTQTVARFIHDVLENITGSRRYEGRKTVKDFYPRGWNPGKFQV